MIFHENHLLVDISHEISYLFFIQQLGKMLQNVSSTVVGIGALRANVYAPVLIAITYACLLDLILTSQATFFSHVGKGLPGLNQY